MNAPVRYRRVDSFLWHLFEWRTYDDFSDDIGGTAGMWLGSLRWPDRRPSSDHTSRCNHSFSCNQRSRTNNRTSTNYGNGC
jgi:hypothetical protein